MALPRQLRLALRSPSSLLLGASLVLTVLNAALLFWLYTLPSPDDSALPGRTPLHDVGPGQ